MKELLQILNDYGKLFVERYGDKLKDARTSGQLADTLRYEVVQDGSIYEVNIHLQDYWQWIEEGRKPGRYPPVDKIREWIQVKPILPQPNGLPTPPTIPQLTYLIGRKIYRDGIEPRPYFQQTLEELQEDLFNAIDAAVSSDIVFELGIEIATITDININTQI